jgi:hypothetical protein
MSDTDSALFTVGVFQDVAWAERGVAALAAQGFPPAALSIIAKDTAETAALVDKALGGPGSRMELRGLGPSIMRGPLVDALQGSEGNLPQLGLAATLRKVGFQAHDSRIFETLVGRGGVLVAVRGDPRAADALATLHSFGGGNAAIGAWRGRV